MTDTSSESEYESVGANEDSSLSDGEVEDCSITDVQCGKLNHDDTSTDTDIECTGAELPKPSDEPSTKRQQDDNIGLLL